MPSAIPHTLTEEEIGDLLFAARTGSLSELQDTLKTIPAPPSALWASAIDAETGNSVLHMAAANGHIEILNHVINTLPPPPTTILDCPNHAGNTALHWASLNGQLEAVKLLVAAGADPTRKNGAGHDAVYEAERAEKAEVVEFLLRECKQVETGAGRFDKVEEESLRSGGGDEEGGDSTEGSKLNGGRMANGGIDDGDVKELEKGMEGMATN